MERKFWLTYDLGVSGDYKNLYAWLDDHKAESCCNNVAFVTLRLSDYDLKDDKVLMSYLKEDIESKVKIKPGNRIYIIRSFQNEEGRTMTRGSFLIGKRGPNPWEGYGLETSDKEEEEA